MKKKIICIICIAVLTLLLCFVILGRKKDISNNTYSEKLVRETETQTISIKTSNFGNTLPNE